MQVIPIRTRPLLPPKDDLLAVITESIDSLCEGDVVAISSKVVAIWQGRCEPIPSDETARKERKHELIREESEWFLEKDERFPYTSFFTIYEGIFGSSAGIDESNGNGHFVLLPRDVETTAKELRSHLIQQFKVRDLGVVIVDSRSQPMRNGVIGIALGHAGFEALYDYRGEKDIFGRELKFERLNTADCIASAVTLAIGEGKETTPLCIVRGVTHISFNGEEVEDELLALNVSRENDIFARFLMHEPWQKGGRNNEND